MEVYLMIRRRNTTIFTDAKETTVIVELKKELQGLLKASPEDIKLFKNDEEMEDINTLQFYGFTAETTKPHQPGMIGATLRIENDEFEQLVIQPYSNPPDLPDVMKIQNMPEAQS